MSHYKDGIYFTKEIDGGVRITVKESAHIDAERIQNDILIDSDGWCSIIASMSASGETSEKWEEAIKFHGVKSNG